MSHERIQANAASVHFCESSDRNLASAAEFVEQRALASGRGAGGGVVQKGEQSSRRASPLRISIPSAPCPAAGVIISAGITCRTSCVLPRRFRPAAARMMAS